ncbi:MAG: hypothetical protein OXH51_02910 [Gemmatimonadetes bacterium]|nr:hypothetical protein [Gemmatimonadota bacterium]
MYYGQATVGDIITVQRRDGTITEAKVLEVLDDYDVAVLVSVETAGVEWSEEEWEEEMGIIESPDIPPPPISRGGCLGAITFLIFLALLLWGCVEEQPSREPPQFQSASPAMQNAFLGEVFQFVETPCDNWLELLFTGGGWRLTCLGCDVVAEPQEVFNHQMASRYMYTAGKTLGGRLGVGDRVRMAEIADSLNLCNEDHPVRLQVVPGRSGYLPGTDITAPNRLGS